MQYPIRVKGSSLAHRDVVATTRIGYYLSQIPRRLQRSCRSIFKFIKKMEENR